MATRKHISAQNILQFPVDVAKGARRRAQRKRLMAYPIEMLDQDYFTLCGDGRRMAPSLAPSMLADEHFVSPTDDLLTKLEEEGHDVSACRAEFEAMRDHMHYITELAASLFRYKMRGV